MIDELIEKYEGRLKHYNKRKEEMEDKHKGNEEKFTYWGGYDYGYIKGKIDRTEEMLEVLEDLKTYKKEEKDKLVKHLLDFYC